MNYMDKFSLHNKVAIVTGGTGILGRRFCTGLAEAGATVVVVDINEEAHSFATSLSEQFQRPMLGIQCNITKPQEVQEMVRTVIDTFGAIHILHNNAAGKSSDLDAFFAPYEDYSLEQWREIMSVNIDGMFLVSQAVGKQMIAQGQGGAIIQTASIYGIMAPDQRIYEGSHYLGRQINSPAVYSASKAAVVGLTKYLATYWAPHNIRVNSLTPGGVESGQNDTFKQNYSRRIPLGRMADGDEMVNALLYLASDASSYVTGHNLIVDGGLNSW